MLFSKDYPFLLNWHRKLAVSQAKRPSLTTIKLYSSKYRIILSQTPSNAKLLQNTIRHLIEDANKYRQSHPSGQTTIRALLSKYRSNALKNKQRCFIKNSKLLSSRNEQNSVAKKPVRRKILWRRKFFENVVEIY